MAANYEKGLYKQYEETVTLLEKVTAKMEEMERRYETKISEMEAEHKKEVAALKEEIRERDEKIKELTAKNDALTEEVSRLKSIINTDSHNSSNPPSTDGKGNSKKANEYPSRNKSEKKQGGQNGHKGKTLTRKDVEKMLAEGTIARNNTKKKSRAALDLSLWDNSADFDDVVFFETDTLQSDIDGKTGDALQSAASGLCSAQIPECSRDMSILQLLYAQKIKSDCVAYENSLKQRKNASQTKLSAAQKALREAALEQIQASNKYDLGQCTIQFKKCMQSTGG